MAGASQAAASGSSGSLGDRRCSSTNRASSARRASAPGCARPPRPAARRWQRDKGPTPHAAPAARTRARAPPARRIGSPARAPIRGGRVKAAGKPTISFSRPRSSVSSALVRPRLADGTADHVERVDVAGALPQQADLGVADQAGVDPLLDVAVAAAHLHGAGGDRHVVAAGAELDERGEDAQHFGGLGRARIAPRPWRQRRPWPSTAPARPAPSVSSAGGAAAGAR